MINWPAFQQSFQRSKLLVKTWLITFTLPLECVKSQVAAFFFFQNAGSVVSTQWPQVKNIIKAGYLSLQLIIVQNVPGSDRNTDKSSFRICNRLWVTCSVTNIRNIEEHTSGEPKKLSWGLCWLVCWKGLGHSPIKEDTSKSSEMWFMTNIFVSNICNVNFQWLTILCFKFEDLVHQHGTDWLNYGLQ